MNPEEHLPLNPNQNNKEDNKENTIEQKVRQKLSKIRPYNKNNKKDNKSLWRYALYGVQSVYESAKNLNNDENLKGKFRLHRENDEKFIICLEKSQRPSYVETKVSEGLGIFTDSAGESDSENYFSAEMEFQQIQKIYNEKLQVQAEHTEKEAGLQTEIAHTKAKCDALSAKGNLYKRKYEDLKSQFKRTKQVQKLISKPLKPIQPPKQSVFKYPVAPSGAKISSGKDIKGQTKES